MILSESIRWLLSQIAIEFSLEVFEAEASLLGSETGGVEQVFARVFSGEMESSLDEADGADAAILKGILCPLVKGGAHTLAAAQESLDELALGLGSLGGDSPRPPGITARLLARIDHEQGVAVIETNQAPVVAYAEEFAYQMDRGRIEGSLDLDVTIRVNAPGAGLEEGEP